MTMKSFMEIFPRELRDMIWSAAAASQFQQPLIVVHIADGLDKPCTGPFAERKRQAFLGYEKLPDDAEKQPLRVYIHESRKSGEMHVVVNEFQALVSCLSIGAVCAEARWHATDYCRTQVDSMDLFYTLDESDMEKASGNVLLEPLFMRPTTVMIFTTNRKKEGPPGFSSAKHLVNVVSRIFGRDVQRIVLRGLYDACTHIDDIYWPHTRHTRRLEYADPIIIEDPSHDPSMIFITPNRMAHARIEFCIGGEEFEKRQCYWHLLKLYEILKASRKKLPRLQHIDVHIQTQFWCERLPSIIKTTRKDDILWVNWNDVHYGFDHRFQV